jgi:uncharacterized membrane protein
MPSWIDRSLATSRAGRIALGTAGGLALLTVIGLVALWPNGHGTADLARFLLPKSDRGEIVKITRKRCVNTRFTDCRVVDVRLLSGDMTGRVTRVIVGEDGNRPPVDVGDNVSMVRNRGQFVEGAPDPAPYRLGDPRRHVTLYVLAAIFCILVVALGRLKGFLALAGLAVSILVVFGWAVPALLEGRAPAPVALTAAMTIMFVATILTHGTGALGVASALGTAATLGLVTALAAISASLASLTGFATEESGLLAFAAGGDLSLSGLVLAGILIGALGVLMDVTVSQASSVMALRRANPGMKIADLYREASAVGRDHVAATVQTLVLAYVGASLPILLLFSVGGVGLENVLDREDVAEEIVATLAGSIGLVAAVPITTALAAALAVRLPASAVPEHGHSH